MAEQASPISLQDLSAALTGLVARISSSVVAVQSSRSRSSGFAWRPGLVVTADEALADEGEITVILPGGETIAARLAGRDATTDIALLRVDRLDLQPAPLDNASLAPGALALVVGSQAGTATAALGVVSHASGPWRSLRGGEIDARLELGMVMRRQAEGGLAVDAGGQTFGMAVFGPRQRVLVIPSATIERVADKLESHGRIARGYLGLGLQRVAVQDGGGMGLIVTSVDPNGPAAAADVRQGDILVTWNGEPVRSVHSLLRALGPDSVGRTIILGLRRSGEPAEARLTITERPLT
jgi:S1-C subfamily serine protease